MRSAYFSLLFTKNSIGFQPKYTKLSLQYLSVQNIQKNEKNIPSFHPFHRFDERSKTDTKRNFHDQSGR